MDEFKITSKAGSAFEIIQTLPEELKKYKLPFSAVTTVLSDFGSLSFQQLQGEGWSAWKSNYLAHASAELFGIADMEIIELHTAQRNNFRYDWEGVAEPSLKALQFNLSYSPFVKNRVWLIGGQQYHTMDFHLSKEILNDYREAYPELNDFMMLVEKKQPARLAGECFLTKKMQQLLSDMEEFDCKPAIYMKNMKARLEIFITAALEVLCTKKPSKSFTLTPDLKEKAMNAKQILTERLDDPPSIAELARLCMSNTFSIQHAFKHLFSMTIDEYSKQARIDRVKHLLLNTDWDLNLLADAAGYYDGSGLSRYFKKHVGCTPGEYRKFGRKQK